MEAILTEGGYARIEALGARLAAGIAAICAEHGLPWRAFHYGPRSAFCLTPDLPRHAHEAAPGMAPDCAAARRLYFANRGIWDAISMAGPQVSFAHESGDVEAYLAVAAAFVAELRGAENPWKCWAERAAALAKTPQCA